MITKRGALERLRQKVWECHTNHKALETWEQKFISNIIENNIGDFTTNQGAVIDKIYHKVNV